ncbi:hypothetical protein [Moraxella lacunata]
MRLTARTVHPQCVEYAKLVVVYIVLFGKLSIIIHHLHSDIGDLVYLIGG